MRHRTHRQAGTFDNPGDQGSRTASSGWAGKLDDAFPHELTMMTGIGISITHADPNDFMIIKHTACTDPICRVPAKAPSRQGEGRTNATLIVSTHDQTGPASLDSSSML